MNDQLDLFAAVPAPSPARAPARAARPDRHPPTDPDARLARALADWCDENPDTDRATYRARILREAADLIDAGRTDPEHRAALRAVIDQTRAALTDDTAAAMLEHDELEDQDDELPADEATADEPACDACGIATRFAASHGCPACAPDPDENPGTVTPEAIAPGPQTDTQRPETGPIVPDLADAPPGALFAPPPTENEKRYAAIGPDADRPPTAWQTFLADAYAAPDRCPALRCDHGAPDPVSFCTLPADHWTRDGLAHHWAWLPDGAPERGAWPPADPVAHALALTDPRRLARALAAESRGQGIKTLSDTNGGGSGGAVRYDWTRKGCDLTPHGGGPAVRVTWAQMYDRATSAPDRDWRASRTLTGPDDPADLDDARTEPAAPWWAPHAWRSDYDDWRDPHWSRCAAGRARCPHARPCVGCGRLTDPCPDPDDDDHQDDGPTIDRMPWTDPNDGPELRALYCTQCRHDYRHDRRHHAVDTHWRPVNHYGHGDGDWQPRRGYTPEDVAADPAAAARAVAHVLTQAERRPVTEWELAERRAGPDPDDDAAADGWSDDWSDEGDDYPDTLAGEYGARAEALADLATGAPQQQALI